MIVQSDLQKVLKKIEFLKIIENLMDFFRKVILDGNNHYLVKYWDCNHSKPNFTPASLGKVQ